MSLSHKNSFGRLRKLLAAILPAALCLLVLIPPAAAQEENKKPKPQVNLNTASVAELARLPGVGQVIARRIARHRERSGPFRKVDELLVIRGISQAKLEKLRPLVTVGEAVPPEEKKAE